MLTNAKLKGYMRLIQLFKDKEQLKEYGAIVTEKENKTKIHFHETFQTFKKEFDIRTFSKDTFNEWCKRMGYNVKYVHRGMFEVRKC